MIGSGYEIPLYFILFLRGRDFLSSLALLWQTRMTMSIGSSFKRLKTKESKNDKIIRDRGDTMSQLWSQVPRVGTLVCHPVLRTGERSDPHGVWSCYFRLQACTQGFLKIGVLLSAMGPHVHRRLPAPRLGRPARVAPGLAIRPAGGPGTNHEHETLVSNRDASIIQIVRQIGQ